jgi:hypothetical protein
MLQATNLSAVLPTMTIMFLFRIYGFNELFPVQCLLWPTLRGTNLSNQPVMVVVWRKRGGPMGNVVSVNYF